MKVLLLSPCPEFLLPTLSNEEITVTQEKVSPSFVRENNFEIGISYGYRHILNTDILAACPFINLHISYLPWNRGAAPNLWSWVNCTPKGVSIHYIDEGIDTGDIIVQQLVPMEESETLKSSYDRLQKSIITLFAEAWPSIKAGKASRSAQDKNAGSFHLEKDRKKLEDYLTHGYNTPVSCLPRWKREDSASV